MLGRGVEEHRCRRCGLLDLSAPPGRGAVKRVVGGVSAAGDDEAATRSQGADLDLVGGHGLAKRTTVRPRVRNCGPAAFPAFTGSMVGNAGSKVVSSDWLPKILSQGDVGCLAVEVGTISTLPTT